MARAAHIQYKWLCRIIFSCMCYRANATTPPCQQLRLYLLLGPLLLLVVARVKPRAHLESAHVCMHARAALMKYMWLTFAHGSGLRDLSAWALPTHIPLVYSASAQFATHAMRARCSQCTDGN